MSAQTETRVLLTGSSGLIGSAITRILDERHTSWTALHHGNPGWRPEAGHLDAGILPPARAVIHLAGAPIADGRWNEERKQKIHDSRVHGTRALAETLAALEQKPDVLVCASAVGIYGERGEERLTETSAPGRGFLPEVVTGWESAADPAREAGIRVVHLRLGVVLSPESGALKKMLPPFRFGLGGPLGDGSMWMSWVHVHDAARAFVRALQEDSMSGAYNLTAPNPVRNRELTRALGHALNRPAFLPVPRFAIKALFGEMGETLLLGSTRVVPSRLEQSGFQFEFPEINEALADLV